jgi:hypothetical protein
VAVSRTYRERAEAKCFQRDVGTRELAASGGSIPARPLFVPRPSRRYHPPPVRSSLLPWISARGASNLCPCCACYSISPSSGLRRARATAFLGRWHLKADRFPKLQVACATMALYWCGRAFDPANINCFGPDELHGNPKGNFQMICWWPSLQELRS